LRYWLLVQDTRPILNQVRFQSNPVYLIPTGTEFAWQAKGCKPEQVRSIATALLHVVRLVELQQTLRDILSSRSQDGG
jgi:hypothetical protein